MTRQQWVERQTLLSFLWDLWYGTRNRQALRIFFAVLEAKCDV